MGLKGCYIVKYIKYRETKEHGTFDFPMEFYHVMRCLSTGILNMRSSGF